MVTKINLLRWIAAIGILVTITIIVGLLTLPSIKNELWKNYTELKNSSKRDLSYIQRDVIRNGLLLEGYRLVEDYPAVIRQPDKTILFVGHIYPRNGFISSHKQRPKGPDSPLDYLIQQNKRSTPARIVFGGDNVYAPTRPALEHLLILKRTFSENSARFIFGNHDQYWKSRSKNPILVKNIYGDRYHYEDLSGIRLVYLHSVQENGAYQIDDEQMEFLQKTLDPTKYRYALVFLHHALWAGDSLHANAAYQNTEEIKDAWLTHVLPLLKTRNVKAVFSGDGGWRQPGRVMRIQGIAHYVTGWSWRGDIPPEWLTIELLKDHPRVKWHKLFYSDEYTK